MVKLIGVSGKLGSGKDSIADALVKHFGFLRFSFAGALRSECSYMLAANDPPVDAPGDIVRIVKSQWQPGDVHLKPTPPEIRRLLQWVGEWRRSQNEDYWVARLAEVIEDIESPIVIPDVRYANEADLIRSRGGKAWLVERQDRAGYDDSSLHSHISERFAGSGYDFNLRIANNGTLADLERKILDIMRCHAELSRVDSAILSGRHNSIGEMMGLTLAQCDWRAEMNRISAD